MKLSVHDKSHQSMLILVGLKYVPVKRKLSDTYLNKINDFRNGNYLDKLFQISRRSWDMWYANKVTYDVRGLIVN